MEPGIIAAIAGGSCALIILASGLRVIREYQRGVVLRLGRRGPLLDPGLRFILPLGIDRLTRVDLRVASMDVPTQEVITHDGVPVQVTVAVHTQVVNPLLAITRVVDRGASMVQVVQAGVRDVVAAVGLRELLLDGSAVRDELSRFVDARSEPWGVRVTSVDVRDVVLPDALQRAMSRHADLLETAPAPGAGAELTGQLEATARLLADQPQDVQTRFLQALNEVRSGDARVLVVPLPTELVQPFVDLQGRALPAPEDEQEDQPELSAEQETHPLQEQPS